MVTHSPTIRPDLLRKIMFLCTIFIGLVLAASPSSSAILAATGTLTVNVFEDSDVDTKREGGEPGIANVTVDLFDLNDSVGAACATTTTNGSGQAVFDSAATASCTGDQLRVEVDTNDYLSGYVIGPVNMTDDDNDPATSTFNDASNDAGPAVQVVDLASDVTINVAAVIPTNYTCDPSNAYAMTTCFINGDSQAEGATDYIKNSDALVGFPYTASGSAFPFPDASNSSGVNVVPPDHLATSSEIGSSWGLAWSQQTEIAYSAAFLKRHVGLGPLGIGGVYAVDLSTGSPVVDQWLDVTDAGGLNINVGQADVPANSDRDIPLDENLPSYDLDVHPLIATVGFGDLDLVTDEMVDPPALQGDGWIDHEFILLVNLFQKKVHVIDTTDKSLVLDYDIPAPSPACSNGEHRPWAVDYSEGMMYVGVVCDGSAGANLDGLGINNDVEMIVYEYNLMTDLATDTIPGTPTVSPTTVFRENLDYEKGYSLKWCQSYDDYWRPWSNITPPSVNLNRWVCWHQPLVADIDFTDDGNMLLAMMDRTTHQWGYFNYGLNPNSTQTHEVFSGGDLLMACKDGNDEWQLESNGQCGGLNSNNGIGNNEGPGGGEFFYGDAWTNEGPNAGHHETANNGVAVLPGSNEVIAAGMDPYENVIMRAGGINWFSTQDGTPRSPGYMLYVSATGNDADVAGSFGKGGGLGDVDLICPQMPINIGDYVWYDADNNGIQDADETPLAGVMVYLELPNGGVVSTMTDENGYYNFEVSRNQSYTLAFDTSTSTSILPSGVNAAHLSPTIADSSDATDANDSDIAGNVTVDGQTLPGVQFTTTRGGESNHTFDAGFIQLPFDLALTKTLADGQSSVVQAGDIVKFTIEITNQGEVTAEQIELVDYIPEGFTLAVCDGEMIWESNRAGDAVTVINESLAPSASISVDICLLVDNDASEGQHIFFAEISGADDDDNRFNVPMEDVDSTPDNTNQNQPGEQDGNYIDDEIGQDGNNGGDEDDHDPAFITVAVLSFDKGDLPDGPYATLDANNGASHVIIDNLYLGAGVDADDDGQPTNGADGDDADGNDDEDGIVFLDPLIPGRNARIQTTVSLPANTTGQLYGWIDFNNDGSMSASEQVIAEASLSGSDTYLIAVPSNANNVMYSRFRLSTAGDAGGTTFAGTAASGEVEDYALARLGDRVWYDNNENGIQDSGESGAANVTVNLLDGDGNPVTDADGNPISTTTNRNGKYRFPGLPADEYRVEFVLPTGYAFTLQNEGSNEGKDSDANPTTGVSDPVTLVAGQRDNRVDAGLIQARVSIGDYVWFDFNADGLQGDEDGLAGATVALLTSDGNSVTDADGNAVEPQITGDDGLYLFSNLLPGDYVVRVTPPAGYDLTPHGGADADDDASNNDNNGQAVAGQSYVESAAVTLSVGDEPTDDGDGADGNRTVDFGFVKLASIGDFVWEDRNANGIQDDGEPGIADVTVKLFGVDGTLQGTTTTDSNGNYSFTDLLPGGYSLEFVPPAGYLISPQDEGDDEAVDSDANPIDGRTALTRLAPGENDPTWDAGLYQLASIGDKVWEDSNGNGLQDDGEPGLEGVIVQLFNGDGELVASTTTDADGMYSFTDLVPGAYSLHFTTPMDYKPSPQGAGSDDAVDSDADIVTGKTDVTILTSGENDTTWDAGFVPNPPASLGDKVWEDSDEDGIQDDGEPPVAGATVNLWTYDNEDDPLGTLLDSTTTDENGMYRFDGLDPDLTYVVQFVDPSSRDFTTQNAGDDAADSDVDPLTGITAPIDLDPGEHDPTIDAGLIPEPLPTASLGDKVWEDTNQNGLQDKGEPPVAGVLVKLWRDDDRNVVPETLVATTVTDENGMYLFDNLEPEVNYVVEFVAPPGRTWTQQNAGDDSDDAIDSDVNAFTSETQIIYLEPGEENLTIDAGLLPVPAVIGNYVWLDENSDGYQDAGEPGIPNVRVVLKDGAGNIIDETVTDANGGYLFTVPAGSYIVDIDESTIPTGMSQTPPATLPGADFGNQDHSGDGYQVTVGGGEENLTADFGYNYNPADDVNDPDGEPTATIGDRVWIDVDGDGFQDAGEVGVAGVTVALYNDPDGDGIYDNLVTATTTDALGNYLFDDLVPGAYVVEVAPAGSPIEGYTQTGDPDDFGQMSTNPDNRTTTPIILGPGDVFLNADFGYQPDEALGTIGDTVWFDGDASGTPTIDGDEYGIAGVSVALIKDMDGDGKWDSGEPIIASDVTDENGSYLFEGLPLEMAYIVWVNDTDNVLYGLTQTYDADGLESANQSATELTAQAPNDLDQDFSYTPAGQEADEGLIGDTIYFDLDQDGEEDEGEPGIEGVIVVLTDADGNEIATAVTDENGHYYFGNLDPDGEYTVTIAPENFADGGALEGLENSGDPDGGNDNTSNLTLSPESPINLAQDFGYTYPSGSEGRIGNLIWFDSNADGQYDATTESPIGGVTVDLYRDLNGNGQVDAGEPRLSRTTTANNINTSLYGGDGNYLFTGLPLGSYVVDVSDVHGVLTGYSHSLGSDQGANNHSKIDPYAVVIGGDQPRDNLKADFGYYIPEAAVGNLVWLDGNRNGIQNVGDNGLADVVVKLEITYPSGTVINVATTTNSDGYYRFGNLLSDEDYDGMGTHATPGTGGGDEPYFKISVMSPDGLTPTIVDAGSDDLVDSDNHNGVQALAKQGHADVPTAPTPPASEADEASYDFGYQAPPELGSIGDYIWLDSNGDGVQDGDETGISGVLVKLLDADGNVVETTTTNSEGLYLFDQVPAGSYTIMIDPETLPDGVVQTYDLDGDLDDQTTITLGEGEDRDDVDFGYEPPAPLGSIGDYIWLDADGDGVQDDDEEGIADVVVILTDSEGNERRTTTDENGRYHFDDLPAGEYTITVNPDTLPEGVAQTYDLDDLLDSTTTVSLAAGQDRDDVDFGYQPALCTGSIGDTVWLDSNGNGAQDENEPGLAGIVLNLTSAGEDGVLGSEDDILYATETTNNEGLYRFSNLPAGRYQVRVDETTVPEGYALTSGNSPEMTVESNCEAFDDADFGYVASLCPRSVMYGVHDAGSFNSQFFTLDLATGQTNALGPEYASYDAESIEIHPTTGVLYTIAGGDGNQDGKLFTIDKETGALTEIGETGTGGANEIVGAAFADDGTLWAFQQNIGLLNININDGSSTVVWNQSGNWEGLAWDSDRDVIYGAEGSTLYRWDPSTQVVEQVCGNNFLPDATEALDFRFDGSFLGGWHNAADDSLSIFQIDVDSCTTLPFTYDMPYNDIESLASEQCVEGGTVEGQITDGTRRQGGTLADFQIELEVDTNGDGNYGISTTTKTDENGNFRFVNLPLGTYRLSIPGSADAVDFGLTEDDNYELVNLSYTGPQAQMFDIYLPLLSR